MKGFVERLVHAAYARKLSHVHRHKYGARILAVRGGCVPYRSILPVYPIAASAAFSISSPEGFPHSTWRTASRAALLSICHRHGYAELSPLEIRKIKGYLVRRAQHGFQPKSEISQSPESFVRHGFIHSCAQDKKIVRPNHLCGQCQPHLPERARSRLRE